MVLEQVVVEHGSGNVCGSRSDGGWKKWWILVGFVFFKVNLWN